MPSRSCTFCEIVRGETPAWIVVDDAAGVGFLDRRPLFRGHTLLVPREHRETLLDMPAVDLGPFFALAQRLARAMEDALGAGGSFVAINNRVSQSVPHAHVHVVPRTRGDGLRGFFWPRGTYASDHEAARYAAKLREAMR